MPEAEKPLLVVCSAGQLDLVIIIIMMINMINIARGTTDPEIDSVTWIKFSNKAPLALVANLATRWRH